MAKEEQQSNQLNLTVVALVALVAIVGLVALVMNAASLKQLATGGQLASASSNTAGEAWSQIQYDDYGSGGVGGGCSGQCTRATGQRCCSGYKYQDNTGACVCKLTSCTPGPCGVA